MRQYTESKNIGSGLGKLTARKILRALQIDRRFALLDLALLATALFLIFTPAKVLFFHIIFILLTFGAFFWRFRAFALRSLFWVAATTVVVVLTVLAGETQVEEIIEIPLLTSILILVFAIAEQRARAEGALRRSEERYHTLFDNLFTASKDVIFITTRENKIVDVNQAMLDLFGYTKEEMIGLDYQKAYIPSIDQDKFQQELKQKESIRDYEIKLYKKDGTEMDCLITLNVWRANNRKILGYQGIIRDITKRKRAEEALRESEERYRHLVELSFDAIVIHRAGQLVYVNTPGVKLFGAASSEELMGKPVPNFVHLKCLDKAQAHLEQAGKAGKGMPLVEEKFVRLDGVKVDVEIAAILTTYQGQPAVQTVIRDITARKRAEADRELLLAIEHEQRMLAETLGEVFLALAAQTSYETVLDEILCQVQRIVSHSAANIMLLKDNTLHTARHQGYQGFGSKELVSNLEQSLNDFPLDAEVVKFRRTLVISDTHQNPQWVMVPESAWIRSFVAVPICLRDHVLGLLRLDSDVSGKFSTRDIERLQPLVNAAAIALENARLYDQARAEIAERIQVEEELRCVAARNQAILDAIPDSIFHFGRDGQILDYKVQDNDLLHRTLGKMAKGKNLNDPLCVPPDLADLILNYVSKTLDTGTMQVFEYQLSLPSTTRDFEARLVVSGPNEVLAIVSDITERKARAAALERERNRVARDLHDSLGQSLGYLHLKLDELTVTDILPNNGGIRSELARMRDVANEAYELVRSMLAAALSSNSTDLATALLAQAKLAGNRACFKVQLISEGQPRSLSPIAQHQVLYIFQEGLSNIVKHANAQRVKLNLIWTEEMLTISLSDDGCGFKTNTARADGHFGLAIMQERAEEINGFLSIASNPHTGTELTLRLPTP